MKTILFPEYLTEFSCIGGACEDTCCAGWNVTIDKKTYQSYRKVQNPNVSDKLNRYAKRNRKANSDSEYAKFVLDENRNCHMMLEDGLCSIHKFLGEEFLCNTCATYPRSLTEIGESLEKSLTVSCPEAARIILLREESIKFIEAEEPKNTRGFANREIELKKFPHFWNLRIFIIQLLQNRQQSIEIRLIILGLFFQKIDQMPTSELEIQLPNIIDDYLGRLDNSKFIESIRKIEGKLEFQINLVRQLIEYRLSSGALSEKYLEVLDQVSNGLSLDGDKDQFDIELTLSKYKDSVEQFYKPFMQEKEYIFENYAVNYVFKNLVPYDYSSFFESYMMLIIQYDLIKIHLIGMASSQQQLNEQMVVQCVQQLAKIIEHNPTYLLNVKDGMEQAGYTTMAHMFSLIKS